MSIPPAGSTKDMWRTWARQVRTNIDWEEMGAAVVGGLREWIVPSNYLTVLVFLPMSHEISLVPLMEADQETRFVATRTPDRGGELSVHELGGPLEVHRLGFLQPHESARPVGPDEIDVALLPGLAFDLFGNRLGRGAGYFDRLLRATRPSAKHVGVVPADLVVDELPVETHDIAVDYLATEEGVIETA
ncbi:MAG: 5-formyltetrahydrofolate cyclo-ligase [bacterium]|nr:5-formyltetrahydrofolate cyclo-ligase [bacterium]MCP4967636.1 5-formyltetrahydrofolate cyclo-ligase [bacterium]